MTAGERWSASSPPGPAHRAPDGGQRRRAGAAVAVVAVLAAGAAVAATLALTRDDDADQPTASPNETVVMFYDSMRRGDCETADRLRTPALLEELRGDLLPDCSQLAAIMAEDPGRMAEVLPQVADVRMRFQGDDVAVADVVFDLPAEQPDGVNRAILLQQADRTWKLAAGSEAEGIGPSDVDLEADVIVFLERPVGDEEPTAFEAALMSQSEVLTFEHLDESRSFQEARRLFSDNQAMLDRIESDPELISSSYRLLLKTLDQATVDGVVGELQATPGVLRVVSAVAAP
ncbi:MAG TPA: permease-like cell division protein FtsX [Acidimicrobiales bacterium]